MSTYQRQAHSAYHLRQKVDGPRWASLGHARNVSSDAEGVNA